MTVARCWICVVLVDCIAAGWDYLTGAYAINNNGDITGYGVLICVE
jgi:hypothetical protein